MKPSPAANSVRARFDRASQAIEDRFGDRPVWFKLLVFVPVLVILSAILMLLVDGLGFGLLAITRVMQHH